MSIFKFKQFSIIQKKSAMKVGTDGVMLGAWASVNNAKNILDIGCGTGLISLMIAQRNSKADIIGIEIDKETSKEANININNSQWAERISIYNTSLQNYISSQKFDLIISNPPFFHKTTFNNKRNIARHSNFLSFDDILNYTASNLSDTGKFSVIIPKESENNFIKNAKNHNLYLRKICNIKGNEKTNIVRVMLELSFQKIEKKTEEIIIEIDRNRYTEDYINLCKDFYLNM